MKPNSIYISMILLFSLLAGAANAEVYRWTDKDGNIHFSDKPQAEDAKQVKINPENKKASTTKPNNSPTKSVKQIAYSVPA